MKVPKALKPLLFSIAAFSLCCPRVQAAPLQMNVHVDQPGARLSPQFYGLMTEEINHAYDGGLYAELVQNRSFKDDANTPVHWSLVQEGGGTGTMTLEKSGGMNPALNVSLKLEVTSRDNQMGRRVGVANDGFWGIPVQPKTNYRVSFYARATGSQKLNVALESADGKNQWATATLPHLTSEWKKYTLGLKTKTLVPSSTNRLVISTREMGTVWLSLVSLFPPTYHQRPNGNRIDLMQKMAAMQPGFLRFPGGNYLDPGHYEWKKTLGPLEQRAGHPGAWSYRVSDGLGLLEFLLWCEDLKMEPLLAVTDGRGWLPAEGDVGPLVQDALDEIEYVTGDAHTRWGARRAQDGHSAPFALRYVEIGNEDFFDKAEVYDARFAKFYDAIKAKYPQLQIIATRRDVKSRRPDVVDDHIYASVADMRRAAHNYDSYDRKAPKIFVGEWATTVGSPTPTLDAALSDAAYLTGLERNADVVVMACYAPLLVNANPGARQWRTNLIGYDALNSYGSPSYYMQMMFSRNRGDVVLPVEMTSSDFTPAVASPPHGAIGVATWKTQAEFKDIRVMQNDKVEFQADFSAGDAGWNETSGIWKTQDGALVQSSDGTPAQATAGDAGWTDYTYSLKARKTGGAEGFLIPFHVQDKDDWIWWNIGGWNNTRTALEASQNGQKTSIGNSSDIKVETGRWYDIRIEVQGRQIRCYLDGKLISEAIDTPLPSISPIYTSATRDLATGDVILKVVNVSDTRHSVQINLQGIRRIGKTAQAQVLAGQPEDVNSIQEPEKIVPHMVTLTGVGTTFSHEFPSHSVTILRLKTK